MNVSINLTWARDRLLDDLGVAILRGYRRAHKHVESPTEEAIAEAISREVTAALDEVLQWGPES